MELGVTGPATLYIVQEGVVWVSLRPIPNSPGKSFVRFKGVLTGLGHHEVTLTSALPMRQTPSAPSATATASYQLNLGVSLQKRLTVC